MILTPSQSAFLINLDRLSRGEAVPMEPWLEDVYQRWTMAHPNHNAFAPEIQMKSFAQAVLQIYLARVASLSSDPQTKRLAERGRLLVVTQDHGQHFELLREDQLKKADATKYELFSPTLTTASTDLNAVLEEQTVLAVITRLEQHQFMVYGAEIQNGKLLIDALHAKGSYKIAVDMNQDFAQPIQFEFMNLNTPYKSDHFVETQLPEQFGTINSGTSMERMAAQQNLMERMLQGKQGAGDNGLNTALMAAALMGSAVKKQKSKMAHDLLQQKQIHSQKTPLNHRTVVQVAAKRMQDQKDQEALRLTLYKEALAAQMLQQDQLNQKNRSENQVKEYKLTEEKKNKTPNRIAAVALGAGGVSLAGVAGVSGGMVFYNILF